MIAQTEVTKDDSLTKADSGAKEFTINWLLNRKPVLKENIKAYDKAYNSSIPADNSDDRSDAVLGQQLKNMEKPSLDSTSDLPLDILGQYDKLKKTINVDGDLLNLSDDTLLNRTITHERTHALIPDPQQVAIKNLFAKYPAYRQREEDAYLNASGEVYSRLMAFRRENNLKPNQVVALPDLKKWRQELRTNELDQYSNDFLIDLFNTVASNSTTPGIGRDDRKEQILNLFNKPNESNAVI